MAFPDYNPQKNVDAAALVESEGARQGFPNVYLDSMGYVQALIANMLKDEPPGTETLSDIVPGAANQVAVTNAGATSSVWSDNLSLPGTLTVGTTSLLTGNVGVGSAGAANIATRIAGSVTAATALAHSLNLTTTLVGAANSDALTMLHITPTFTPGSLTGLVAKGIRVGAFSVAGFTTPGDPVGLDVGIVTGTGATTAAALQLSPPTGASTNYLIRHTTAATFNVTGSGALTAAGAGTFGALLTVAAGGAAITGNSTIVGTLGSVTTLSAVTGTFTGALTSNSPTAGIGYATGAGGAQTQGTDKATTVVSNTLTTAITMNAAALNAGIIVSFTFTNSSIAATDTVFVRHQSAGTMGCYDSWCTPGSGTSTIYVKNISAGNLSEAIVLRVTILKSVSA